VNIIPCLLLLVLALAAGGCSRTPSAQEILGTPLPATAADVRVANKGGLFGGDSYLSASMTRQEFAALAQQLSLRHRVDLLDYWPSALHAQDAAWWTVTATNDSDTLFGEQPSTYLVARYESGRLFFKRHVY
jgi:hypothetical protein